jgi:hypothetical protein
MKKEKFFLKDIDLECYVPCPLTKNEILSGLDDRGYPTSNNKVINETLKICRMIEELHGITLKTDKVKIYKSRMYK